MFPNASQTSGPCVDVDECSNPARNNCTQICNNTDGGFVCLCFPQYVKLPTGECQSKYMFSSFALDSAAGEICSAFRNSFIYSFFCYIICS